MLLVLQLSSTLRKYLFLVTASQCITIHIEVFTYITTFTAVDITLCMIMNLSIIDTTLKPMFKSRI